MTLDQSPKQKTEWAELIAKWEKSGLSQKEFCQQQRLVLTTFVYYRSVFKKKTVEAVGDTPSFKPVKIITKDEASEIKLALPNGFQCSFTSTIDAKQLKNLVEVLLTC